MLHFNNNCVGRNRFTLNTPTEPLVIGPRTCLSPIFRIHYVYFLPIEVSRMEGYVFLTVANFRPGNELEPFLKAFSY
jgi:hypothetical protein